ncbi:SdpI/YhfL protein family protein [Pseudidiomarina planktonica]|uniref:SdpI/YhfL protein family protein n=1 Tax=Pseudidiomarina planktonica TaxID=1323738 RepID=A0A1Y6ES64_9GAMM|nr:SdpI family protein [Pseudidiomarina planktonica]RUO65416.1 hypothetical protein CWI77_02855 [Pseudidiomarina planktonica]SMQ65099.1 SdpI/YhfL protein family protein [Pseudidiomarina planktonica]
MQLEKFVSFVSYATSILFTAIGIPLALKMVPPNSAYGVRIDQTLSSTEAWYSINTNTGIALIIAGIVSLFLIYLINNRLSLNPNTALVLILALPITLVITAFAITIAFYTLI